MIVAALFVREDSHYKSMGLDCYDLQRDARTWPGGCPAIYHPPCRSWGRYKTVAKPRPGEKELARWAIANVRRFGGVLEHPASSELWRESGCSRYGIRDQFGGVLFPVMQSWWGHRAPKETSLYLVGGDVPDLLSFYTDDIPSGRIENMCRAERERTPLPFAMFLRDLAATCKVSP